MKRFVPPDSQLSLDLFFDDTVPAPASNADGVFALRGCLGLVIKAAIENSGKTRAEIAAEMARLTRDKNCTENMLNAYTAASRKGWEVPLLRAMAFDKVVGQPAILSFYAEQLGARVFVGRDALLAELGRAEILKDELSGKIKRIKSQMESGK